MKRFFSGLVAVVLILTFIVCIYCYGENRRFSLEYYIENLSNLKTSFFLTNIALVWSMDDYLVPNFREGGVSFYSLDPYSGDNDVLNFFDSLRRFFMRCTHTGGWLARTAADLLSNFSYLLPWNAVVDSEGNRIPVVNDYNDNRGGSGGSFDETDTGTDTDPNRGGRGGTF